MLIGYMRVSKSDGSQTIDLQRYALIRAGVDPAQIYEARASGRLDARPGIDAMLKALRTGDSRFTYNSRSRNRVRFSHPFLMRKISNAIENVIGCACAIDVATKRITARFSLVPTL